MYSFITSKYTNFYYKHLTLGFLNILLTRLTIYGCILNPGHGKIPAPDFNFYMQKDKYPI